MTRRPLIAANWKMNLNISQATELAEQIRQSIQKKDSGASTNVCDCDVMIAPSFTLLPALSQIFHDSKVILAGQNVCWAESGAFTGEISPPMLKELGCQMAIIGHSERRHIFNENDEIINKRLKGAMSNELVPILCIGEKLEARESGQTFSILEEQIRGGLQDVNVSDPQTLIVAYEPVWAIGTGKTASVEQAQEVHVFVRSILADIFDKTIASQLRILYGGSVNPANIDSLMAQDDIDGALVGGAALKFDSFDRLINFS